jgi:predicted GNAT family acetyltransferase
MGLGKRLVSHVTEIILQDGNVPIYWTEPENIASQSLAKSLGYYQIGQKIIYRWRKKE